MISNDHLILGYLPGLFLDFGFYTFYCEFALDGELIVLVVISDDVKFVFLDVSQKLFYHDELSLNFFFFGLAVGAVKFYFLFHFFEGVEVGWRHRERFFGWRPCSGKDLGLRFSDLYNWVDRHLFELHYVRLGLIKLTHQLVIFLVLFSFLLQILKCLSAASPCRVLLIATKLIFNWAWLILFLFIHNHILNILQLSLKLLQFIFQFQNKLILLILLSSDIISFLITFLWLFLFQILPFFFNLFKIFDLFIMFFL